MQDNINIDEAVETNDIKNIQLSKNAQFLYNQILNSIDIITEKQAMQMIKNGNISNQEAEEIRNRLGI